MTNALCRTATILMVSVGVAGCGSGQTAGATGQTCSYNGKTYPNGVTWLAADGCNECWCLDGDRAGCTALACGPGDGGVQGDPSCTYAGESYPFGVSFPSTDGCNFCECTWRWYHGVSPGPWEAACTLKDCSGDPGGKPLSPTDAAAEGCDYNGKTYPTEVYFPSADGCDECHCRADGLVTCTFLHSSC